MKNSFKKLLTASLIVLSYSEMNAVQTQNNNSQYDPKRNLAVLQADIATLGTPADVSGIYAQFIALGVSDAAILAAIGSLAVTEAADTALILANLSALAASEATANAAILAAIASLTTSDLAILAAIAALASSEATNTALILANIGALSAAVSAGFTADAAANALILANVGALSAAVSAGFVAQAAADAAIVADIAALSAVVVADDAAILAAISALTFDVSGFSAIFALIASNLASNPITQVVIAMTSPVLTTPLTSLDPNVFAIGDLIIYNTDLATALAAASVATTFATESNANTAAAIATVDTAIASFNVLAAQWNADGFVPSSAYSVAEVSAALGQLKYSLTYLLTQQPV